MDETMNNFTWTNDTTSTGGSIVWATAYGQEDWMPYVEIKYKPKWHITQGYKIQISTMWK